MSAKPVARVEQRNLFPGIAVDMSRPEVEWLIPYAEVSALPHGTVLCVQDHPLMATKALHTTIGKLLADAMAVAAENGADSRSMPDEYVALAAWLAEEPISNDQGKLYHAALQRIGTALKLPVGSDLTTEVVPVIIRLRERNKYLQEERDQVNQTLNVFWSQPWYKRVWRAIVGDW